MPQKVNVMRYLRDIVALSKEILMGNPRLARVLLTLVIVLFAGVVAKILGLDHYQIRDLVSAILSLLSGV